MLAALACAAICGHADAAGRAPKPAVPASKTYAVNRFVAAVSKSAVAIPVYSTTATTSSCAGTFKYARTVPLELIKKVTIRSSNGAHAFDVAYPQNERQKEEGLGGRYLKRQHGMLFDY